MARNMTTAAKGRTTKARRVAGAPAMRLSGGSRHSGLDFAVSVDPVVLKTLSTQPASVKNLVDRFGKHLARAQKSGQSSGFTVLIDAGGKPRFEPLPVNVFLPLARLREVGKGGSHRVHPQSTVTSEHSGRSFRVDMGLSERYLGQVKTHSEH
jgi:hypothetical protein